MKRIKTKPTIYYGTPNVPGIIERMGCQHKGALFTRVWAMPNHETFKIEPIARLLRRYAVGLKWVDPFAGANSPAELTNDHNPVMPTKYHMEAIKFSKSVAVKRFVGVLFDPPYSFRQISEHYKVIGKKATQRDTSMAFYEKVKSALCEKISRGGVCYQFRMEYKWFWKSTGVRDCGDHVRSAWGIKE